MHSRSLKFSKIEEIEQNGLHFAWVDSFTAVKSLQWANSLKLLDPEKKLSILLKGSPLKINYPTVFPRAIKDSEALFKHIHDWLTNTGCASLTIEWALRYLKSSQKISTVNFKMPGSDMALESLRNRIIGQIVSIKQKS